eukprot:7934612-Alexandrium_andersonii.AAC.1
MVFAACSVVAGCSVLGALAADAVAPLPVPVGVAIPFPAAAAFEAATSKIVVVCGGMVIRG